MTSQELSELKPGDTVYLGQLPVKFKSIKNTVILNFEPCETSGLLKGFEHVSRFSIRPMLPQPKYDPCRLFRKGDKAKPRIINGREIPKLPLDVIFTVTGDEDKYGVVPVEYISPVIGLPTSATVHAIWLELVTPVEEEPYYIEKACNRYELMKRDGDKLYKLADYWDTHPRFKAAAEAERDRLNAEHRKEKGNENT